jgi:hypothetical protein
MGNLANQWAKQQKQRLYYLANKDRLKLYNKVWRRKNLSSFCSLLPKMARETSWSSKSYSETQL